MQTIKVVVVAAFLVGCTSTVVQYPSVCPNNDKTCQRNLNAQTLSIIGKDDAALELMRQDPEVGFILDNGVVNPCGLK